MLGSGLECSRHAGCTRSRVLQHVTAVRLTLGFVFAIGCATPQSAPDQAPRREVSPQSWIDHSVAYGVLPPLFGPSGLPDVTAALDSLHRLGVDVLWLSPIFEAPPGDFGYAVTNFERVRSDYGTDADLAALVREAHRRDMRVLLDLPANHTSAKHRWFVDAAARGRESPYYAFYARDAEGGPTHYFDWTHLPNLDYENTAVARYMRDTARGWIVKFSIDGFRIDAAWGIRQRSPEYWPRFNADMRAARADVFILAEASARDPYYVTHGFDAAYDWTSELGVHAWKGVFDTPDGIAQRLHAAVVATQKSTPAPHRTWRFINNNDTAERFITRHGDGLTRVATAALLTLPGIPCLYSFDEIGAEFLPYSALKPVTGDRPELRAFHERWIHLRRAHAAFSGAGFTPLYVGTPGQASGNAYVFLRHAEGRSLLVALNFSAERASVSVELPSRLWNGSSARDPASGGQIAAEGGKLALELGPWDARALEPR
jgi:cyclomaltodextrinase / maltogenic alpha-amylase / neopullulanase